MKLNFAISYKRVAVEMLSYLIILATALAIGAIILALDGADPLKFYEMVFISSIGRTRTLTDTLILWSVFLTAGLSALIPFRAKVWSLGTEGQIIMGALGATLVFTFLRGSGNFVLILLASLFFGTLWGGLVGVLKSYLRFNELITTILLNIIAALIASYAVGPMGPLRDPSAHTNQSYQLPSWGVLPSILGSPLNAGIILAFLLATLCFILISRTTLGYEIRTLSGNPLAARHAGIRVEKIGVVVMLIGGALGGVAGLFLLTGVTGLYQNGFSANYGYVGIAIAVLAGLHPIGVIISSLFFTLLYIGGELFLPTTSIPQTFIHGITAVIIVAALLRPLISGKLKKILGVSK